MRVLVVLFDGVQSLDVTGPVEVFAGANTYARAHGQPDPYAISTMSLGAAPVRTSSGLRLIPDGDLGPAKAPDLLLVPGGEGTRQPDPEVVIHVGRLARRSRRIMSVCTGALLLAEVGVLDGRRATTHWAMCSTMATRFPAVQVDPEPIFVRDGHVSTSAGVTAGIDLALAFVEEDLGRDAALAIARHLVMFLRRPGSQAQFSVALRGQLAEKEPFREVQQWIAERPGADLSVEALAQRARLSPRQFARAFTAQTGTSPGRYVDLVRLEAARRLLVDTGDGVEQIARACGYGVAETMRRAFQRALGVSPLEYRRRF